MRLWSHVVAPVFRELLCLGGCAPRVTNRAKVFFTGRLVEGVEVNPPPHSHNCWVKMLRFVLLCGGLPRRDSVTDYGESRRGSYSFCELSDLRPTERMRLSLKHDD
ncbi:hypothetical protein Taro_020903 [Colocasia esculenta]|uniref:Secreted protein n=1 Tax=Colocasia esculenta TaxID=4460 RepID=A0A843UPW0_COLES|nr:hypothetical protein [Colocasia esculenta]